MKFYIAALSAILLFSSCNNDAHTEHKDDLSEAPIGSMGDGEMDTISPNININNRLVKAQINTLFENYLDVKNALVNSNADEANKAARNFLQVIKLFDKSYLSAEVKPQYDFHVAKLKEPAFNISSTKDIEKQREHFNALSINAYELAKAFGANKKLYQEYCPMAFNDQGAFWLSDNEEIMNPYYGEKMMSCGSVEQIIEKQN